MNVKDTSRHNAAAVLASTIVAAGTLVLPATAFADHNSGEGGPLAATPTAIDIDDHVFLRRTAMAQTAVD